MGVSGNINAKTPDVWAVSASAFSGASPAIPVCGDAGNGVKKGM
jgi:hypothetical protein